MAATKAQIATKVLQKLRILPAGKSATADDSTLIQNAYDEMYQYLLERNAVTWGSTDSIPTEAVRPIVKLMAYEIADDFLSNSDEGRIQRLMIEAWGNGSGGAFGELVRLAKNSYEPTTTEADYF